MELGSMPMLKLVNFVFIYKDIETFVKDNLPHLSINEKELVIGLGGRNNPEDGFWEIQTKQLKIFEDHNVPRNYT